MKNPFSRRFDETNYTSALRSAIDKYLTALGHTARIATPGSQYQGIRRLDQSDPWDLIAKIGDFELLILEIKIANHKKNLLESFNLQQLFFDAAMQEAGVPLWYCYNLKTAYEGLPAEDTLNHSNTAEPKNVCNHDGLLCNIESHVALKMRIDELLNGGNPDDPGSPPPNGTALGVFFSKEAIDQVYQLNAPLVFLLCNTKCEEIICFQREELRAFVGKISETFSLQGIDFNKASPTQMSDHFRLKIQELSHILIPEAVRKVAAELAEKQRAVAAVEERRESLKQEQLRQNAQSQTVLVKERVRERVRAR